MINRFIKFFSSMKFVVLLLLIFAFSIGYATFIENDFGTSSAKALIYNTWWFALLLIILGISLILNMFQHKLFRKEKLAILCFHLSFIVILIGAGITRYIGYEGYMQINKDTSENRFISSDIFLQIKVNDKENEYSWDEKLYLSGITKRFDQTPILKNLFSNYFSISDSRLKQDFSITYSDFIPNLKDSVSKEISGIHLYSSLVSDKKGTEISESEMMKINILSSDIIDFKGVNFTLNNQQNNSVNFYLHNNKLSCVSDFQVQVSSMPISKTKSVIYEIGEKFEINPRSLLLIKENTYMFGDFSYNNLFSSSNNMDENTENNPDRTIDALVLEVKAGNQSKKVILNGGRKFVESNITRFKLGDLYFSLVYGPKYYELPFSIGLDCAETRYYSGQETRNNIESYKSHVTITDGENIFSDSIFMNNILNHKGFRFYQSNIDVENGQWTGFSVNYDRWGTFVTYIGYALMMLGMILGFFFKKTRFNALSKKLNNLKRLTFIVLSTIILSGCGDSDDSSLDSIKINEDHSKKFERLLVEHNGRIKPMSTFSSEIIRKLTGKESVYDQSPSQVLLGMKCYPHIWSKALLIKVNNKELLDEIESRTDLVTFNSLSSKSQVFGISFNTSVKKDLIRLLKEYNLKIVYRKFQQKEDCFLVFKVPKSEAVKVVKKLRTDLDIRINKLPDEEYMFYYEYLAAAKKHMRDRSKKDKEHIKLKERWDIFNDLTSIDPAIENRFLTIFVNDSISIDRTNCGTIKHKQWKKELSFKKLDFKKLEIEIPNTLIDSNKFINCLDIYFNFLRICNEKNDLEVADQILIAMQEYQINNGGDLIPSNWKIELEILYNKVNVFHQLFLLYFFSGLISLILLIFQMFYNKKWINMSIRFLKVIIISGLLIHTLGIISRWIIAGHAPWTNSYEAMIYTVWATMISGLIFSRKSDLTLAATTLVSSILLLFAFISYMDPTITNAVPVLNSYWLMIHVSLIVASYGFLIMGGSLGLLSLILMISKSRKNKEIINLNISELTIINEKTLIVGLYMLAIGTFLGGVWANESWGRYWGWDAKETWALVTILLYAFILHMRFIPVLKGKYIFNVASVLGLYSVLMTYFGVNHLLSGLHSYGAGEDVGIPNYIWISVLVVIIISILAKLNHKRHEI